MAVPKRNYYICDPNAAKGFREVSESEWQARPMSVVAQPTFTKTCKVIIKNGGTAALNGYAASVYKDDKFYCNYIIPDYRNYNIIEIENVVCGSMLILYTYAASFEGAEPLEDIALNGNTHFFKVANCDMEIEVK